MYAGHGFRDFEIGDVDVIKHDGIYHLFHLTLPNHDYIAHAVSEDGLKWRRVKNALFISDPGAWDDDMLWTMHISPDPYQPSAWRMFYTGLCLRQRGRIQRIGLARSDDLYTWHKDTSSAYPLEVSENYYEHTLDEGRHWVSFRDPFCFQDDGEVYLLAAARINHGPVIRRGCVALLKEKGENQFIFCPPLFHPMQYDDVEVPNVVKLHNRYYLIGSIREDIKVHYWYADKFDGPYRNFFDNVLLPQGNYAARISREGDRYLIWNFFFTGVTTQGRHLMAPPKELVVGQDGQLHLQSFQGFDSSITETLAPSELAPQQPLFINPHASAELETAACTLWCESGFEAFLLQGKFSDFILTGKIILQEEGKCGLVFRLTDEGDGYYISLDLIKGIAQIRAWKYQPDGGIEAAFQYDTLQVSNYVPTSGPSPFRLVAYEQYIELSVDGFVHLTLADDKFTSGRVGFYVEGARIRLEDLQLNKCDCSHAGEDPTSIPYFAGLKQT